ncbi:MAG: sulfatase-like hydrolase/transferase, partial [Planctomycetota bacterium]
STDIPPYFYIRNDQAVQAPTLQVEERTSPGWTKIQGEFSRAGLTSPNLKLNDVLPRFTTEAISVIDRHRKENSAHPLFLYLAYPAPHTPWLPSAEFVASSRASMYGDFCQMVDANVGKVLNSLQKNGMTENTMVIFTSDNGPVWYPDDVKRFQHDCSGGLRGMKADGWEGGHRMPFIVRWPAKTQPGSVSNQIICFTDLMATFAELVGYKIKNKTDLDSVSFLGVLLGMITESNPVRDYLVIAAGNGMKTIRKGQWKYLDGPGPGGFSRKHFKVGKNQTGGQLYNLKTDPGEQVNLFDECPDLVSELKLEMDRIVQKNDQTNRE